MKRYWTFIILLFIFNTACKKSDDIIMDVEAEILKEMEAHNIPSLVACLVKDGEIVWEGAFGYSNVEYSIPASRVSIYSLQSITKLVLATAVMQLWENGKIDLEADINQYLNFDVRNPNFPNQKITPYMLLHHTSGLAWPHDDDLIPDFHHFYSFEEPPPISKWLPEYILPQGEHYRKSVWKDFAPGEKFLYSNIGTSLLALVVEEITKKDYRDYCQENILEPLEMYNTAFRLNRLNQNLLATPYTDDNNPMYYFSNRHYPAGFLSTNIEDFSHFIIAILNYGAWNGKRILKRSTVEKMLQLQNTNYGISYLWDHYIGNNVGHIGGGTGFSTWSEWFYGSNGGLFIFSNKRNNVVYRKGRIYELVRYKYS